KAAGGPLDDVDDTPLGLSLVSGVLVEADADLVATGGIAGGRGGDVDVGVATRARGGAGRADEAVSPRHATKGADNELLVAPPRLLRLTCRRLGSVDLKPSRGEDHMTRPILELPRLDHFLDHQADSLHLLVGSEPEPLRND